MEQAKAFNPRYVVMIIPARWYSGGIGLGRFRNRMLNDLHLRLLHDYPKSRDCFAGVDIAGGVCYFLWDRDHAGICTVENQTGAIVTMEQRFLNEFPIFIRDNIGLRILRRISRHSQQNLSNVVCSISPFGLPTSERGTVVPSKDSVTLISSHGRSYISKERVLHPELIRTYKVCIGQLNPDRGGVNKTLGSQINVTTKVAIYGTDEVTTATYLVLGTFRDEKTALQYAQYIRTRFVRFLVSLTMSSMHLTKNNFCFVPLQDFSESWTDEKLYEKYGLTADERAYIERRIRPME